jgi:nitrogen fixation/metabolism regulation signal transduction histidine kinase
MQSGNESTAERPWPPAVPVFFPAVLAATAGAALTAFDQAPPIAFVGALTLGLAASWLGWRRVRDSIVCEPRNPPADVHEDLARQIADSNPDAVLFFSDRGTIRYANPAAQELFFEGEKPEGRDFLALMAHAPAALRESLLGEADRLFSVEVDGQHETYHVSRRSFALHGELHTLLIVKHLTREIARREVDVLKRVIRIISHEVNNSLAPVTSLVHSARLIAKSPDAAAKLERVFDTIEERAGHLGTFLDGYAKLARLPKPRSREIDWEPFLRHVAELHPGVRLPAPPRASGWFDPAQIEQVVINLVKNATEAGSAPGDVEIEIAVENGVGAEIRVLDRGPGFSEEALKSALFPLYTTKEHGSGMGLALSREIVEAHGGSLAIANREQGGARISVRLPGRVQRDAALTHSRVRLTLTRA